MLMYFLICLCVSLFSVHGLVASKVYTKEYRLLPLLLGLFSCYDILEVIAGKIDYAIDVDGLEYLVMVHIMFVSFYVICDVLHIHINRWSHMFIIALLSMVDLMIYFEYRNKTLYHGIMKIFSVIYCMTIVVMIVWVSRQKIHNKREYVAAHLLLGGLFLISVGMCVQLQNVWHGKEVFATSMVCFCMICIYMYQKGYLADLATLLRSEYYDSSKTPIILFDEKMFFLDANKAAKSYLQKEFEDYDRQRNFGAHYLEKVQSLWKEEQKENIIYADGKYVEYLFQKIEFPKSQYGYMISLWDMTQQMKDKQNLITEKNVAQELVQEKGRVLASVSHDLKTPIHAILGVAGILERKVQSPQQKNMIKQIYAQGVQMSEWVEDILIASKLENGSLVLQTEEFGIDEWMEMIGYMAVMNIGDKPIDFKIDYQTRYPKEIVSDRKNLQRIIMNLISNAVKFTQSGEIVCELAFEYMGQWRYRMDITVRDTGCGMKKEEIESACEEYYSNASNKKQDGTGLGLTIAKRLAECMGGGLDIQSDGETKTAVHIYVMVEVRHAKTLEPKVYDRSQILLTPGEIIHDAEPDYVYPDAKILLADDIRINRELFCEVIAPWKVSVVTAEDGEEAFELMQKDTYDLIVLDGMMPKLSGYEVVSRYENTGQVPVILMSAALSTEDISKSRAMGFFDFLEKPLDMRELKRVLETYLPKELREEYQNKKDTEKRKMTYEHTHNLYRQEMKEKLPLLIQYQQDIENRREEFRVLVHGIKSASYQVGFSEIGELAEVLEMAAKTDNIRYIHRHFEHFTKKLTQLLELLDTEFADEAVDDLEIWEG